MPASWNTSRGPDGGDDARRPSVPASPSPEGTAGFGGEGLVVRILTNDPDITRLLERHHRTYGNVGIGT